MNKRNYSFPWVFALILSTLLVSACGLVRSYDGAEQLYLEAEVPMEAPVAEESYIASDVAFADERASFSAGEPMAEAIERVVIRNASISIVVADPAESMDSIVALAEGMGGFVVSSNLYQMQLASGAEVPSGDITVRVPAGRLNEALGQIEGAAIRVLSKNQSGQDVTREYTDLQSRLRNLEEAEDQLREIMASAIKTEDVLAVYNQLTYVTEQIEVLKGQIQYYDEAAAMSAITISLTAEAALQPLTIGGWQPVGIAKDAIQTLINTLQVLVNIVIWLVLYALPVLLVIAIPLALLWRGVRTWRLRRKEKAAAKGPAQEKD